MVKMALLICLLISGRVFADPAVFSKMDEIVRQHEHNRVFRENPESGAIVFPGEAVELVAVEIVPVGKGIFKTHVRREKTAKGMSGQGVLPDFAWIKDGASLEVPASVFEANAKGVTWAIVRKAGRPDSRKKSAFAPEARKLPGCSGIFSGDACLNDVLGSADPARMLWEICYLESFNTCRNVTKALGRHFRESPPPPKLDRLSLFKGLLALSRVHEPSEAFLVAGLEWPDDGVLEKVLSEFEDKHGVQWVRNYLDDKNSKNRPAIAAFLAKTPRWLNWVAGKGEYAMPGDLAGTVEEGERSVAFLEKQLRTYGWKSDEAYFSKSRAWDVNDCSRALRSLPQRYGGFHLNLAMIAAILTDGSLFTSCPANAENFKRANGQGETVLHYLAKYGRLEPVFAKHFALSLDLKTAKGETILDWARKAARPDWGKSNVEALELMRACQLSVSKKIPPKPERDPCLLASFDTEEGRWMKREMCGYCGSRAAVFTSP